MSFKMIFSIILVITFLGFGFYAITKMVEMQETVQIEKFKDDFQEDVKEMWEGSIQGSETKRYILPKKIEAVCFTDNEIKNMEFKSENIIPGKDIKYLNLEKILDGEKIFCVENINGRVSLILSKEFGENLVSIK